MRTQQEVPEAVLQGTGLVSAVMGTHGSHAAGST